MKIFNKIILLFSIILATNFTFGQKIVTKSGQVKFLASNASALEEVSATNSSVSAVMDSKSGAVAIQALIKSFKFKIPLMEEHFNENYLESDKFPKATFSGKIANFDASKVNATKKSYDVEGDFSLHGVTKHIKFPAMISKENGKTLIVSTFGIKPEDYNIKIPSLIKQKITENSKIWVNFSF
ncbi:YceI family protein [Kaistella sp. G5-32]|uniref:YceI family protein n=1 Tax=Kaistella gelatinilytica TaxID=2787636 RepID=A0ABS0F9U4_9FLAO|nr:YceI family protein [Kaistella gelatinilytica]MBF8456486.1 YceI family protein [Kaistella gelatinilytica]